MSETRVAIPVEEELESVEVDFSDIHGACSWCGDPLTFLEEDLETCERCAWEIDAWRLAEGTARKERG